MPYFKYEALKRDGSRVHASVFAPSLLDLEETLKHKELILVEAEQLKQKSGSKALIYQFIAEFAPLIQSGISIDRALAIIGEDTKDSRLTLLANGLYDTIKKGGSLSQAMQETGVFDSYALALVQAGEASGQLADVLKSLESHYQTRSQLKNEVISALAYPAILFTVSLLSLIAISHKVIPRFEELFIDKENALPLHTRIVFAFSNFLKDYGLEFLVTGLIIVLVCLIFYRRSVAFKFRMDALALRTPILGGYLNLMQGANFSTMLGVLLKSGVPLLQSLDLSKNIYNLGPLQEGAEDVITEVRRGQPLYEAVDEIPFFQPLAKRFIKVGEEAGNLGDMIAKAGEILSSRLQHRLRRFSSVLGPMVILVMGALIGIIVWSMLSAVYSFSDAL